MATRQPEFTGLDEYIEALRRAGENAEGMAKKALYEGAKIMADEIRQGVTSIRTDGVPEAEKKRREKQKAGLLDSLGISEMRNDNGYINVKIGFVGYNDVKTPKYPNGQPNQMIARTFNSGNSFTRKQSFFDKAVRNAKDRAEREMQRRLEIELEHVMGN